MSQFITEVENNPKLNKFWPTIKIGNFQFSIHWNIQMKIFIIEFGKRFFSGRFLQITIH